MSWRAAGGRLLILSLDTTTREGSVAVVRDDEVLVAIAGDPTRTHGQRLPTDLGRALDAARTRLDEIDLLAVAVGPGSFTGLRVGIATVQGLAFSRGLQIVPVSSLEALARAAAPASGAVHVAAWIDAHRGEVFASLYAPGLTREIMPASSAGPDETLRRWLPELESRDVLFAGDGAIRYREAIGSALGGHATVRTTVPSLAASVGRIASREPQRAVLPHAVVPVYVRRSDAELARDRARPV